MRLTSPTHWCAQVRVGLESADAGAYQARVGQTRLLGELYNYRVVDSKCAPASRCSRAGAGCVSAHGPRRAKPAAGFIICRCPERVAALPCSGGT